MVFSAKNELISIFCYYLETVDFDVHHMPLSGNYIAIYNTEEI